MKVIAIVCKKGGVGKSVTSVSLSAGLARRGYRTLLIDTDSQGSASINLGFHPVYTRHEGKLSLGDFFYDQVSLAETIYRTWLEGLDIILASSDLVRIDMYYASYKDWAGILNKELYKLNYDFIIIDTPPALSMITINALVACTGYVIPIPPLRLDIHTLQTLLAEMHDIRQLGTIGCLYGVLLTRVRRYKTSLYHINLLKEYFVDTDIVFNTQIEESVKIPEAAQYGRDVYSHSRRSKAAKSYEMFIDELIART